MSWPPWHLSGEPLGLVKYVLPAQVQQYLTLPGSSGASALQQLRAVYDALAAVGVGYALESPSEEADWQVIRTPDQVLRAPRHGTCLDLAVTMAGACLVARLHPVIIIAEPEGSFEPAHALLAVWLGSDGEDYPIADGAVWWTEPPEGFHHMIQREVDGAPLPFVVVDPVGFSRALPGAPASGLDVDFAAAVRNGADYLVSGKWRWRLAVDIRRTWRQANTLSAPVHPAEPLPTPAPPLGDPGRSWIFEGGQGRSHFVRHAYARRLPVWRDDAYVGRQAALRRIIDHCTGERDAGFPLVITGQPGAGKSTVLARAVHGFESGPLPGVAVHARDAGLEEIVSAVARACGITVTSEGELVQRLSEAPPVPMIVAVDALDEMRTSRDRNEAALLLRDLAALDGIRVVVGTRSLASERRAEGPSWRRSDLVRLLFSGSPRPNMLVDLDSDEYFAAEELVDLVRQILARNGGRSDLVREGLAAKIQQRAQRNYLVAAMTASLVAIDENALDPQHPEFSESALPDGIGEALDKFINRLGDGDRVRVRGLLTALAYARGSGLTAQRWLRFARALGFPSVTRDDIEQLKQTGVADYLLENLRKDGRLLTGLFHRALADHLRSARNRTGDESAICDVLLADAADKQWDDGYIRRFLPSHVLAAARCEEFLAIPEFLTFCYPSSVGPVARAVRVSHSSDPASVFRLAFPYLTDQARDNAGALELAARTQGAHSLANRIRGLWSNPLADILCIQARPSQVPVSVFLQHAAAVRDVCGLPPAPGRGPTVVTTSDDGTARVWDPFDPEVPQLAQFDGHSDGVTGVAVLPWPGRESPVVVTTSRDGTARVWDPFDPEVAQLAQFDGHSDGVTGVAVLPWPGRESPVVVTTSRDGTARVWDPFDPEVAQLARFDGHSDWVSGVAVLPWPGRASPVVVTTSGDGTARVWDPTSVPVEEVFVYEGHRGRVRSALLLNWEGRPPVCATGADDGTVQIWGPDGENVELLGIYDAHSGAVQSAVYVEPPEPVAPVMVSVCSNTTAHVWDPHQLVAERTTGQVGHSGRVRSATFVPRHGDEQPLLVTASNDGTARTWEVVDGVPVETGVFDRHSDWVRYIEPLPWPGRASPVVATASGDKTVRVWDPAAIEDGELARFDRHGAPVRSVSAARVAGIRFPVLLTAAADGTARLWNPYGLGEDELAVLEHPDIVRRAIMVPTPDHRSVVAAATGSEVYVWDLDVSREVPVRVFRAHDGWVRDLAVLTLPEGIRICSVSNDATLRIWDPFDLRRETVGRGHGDWIWGVTTMQAGADTMVVTTSADGTVRIWRPSPDAVTETGRLQLTATGLSVRSWKDQLAVTTSRGFVVYRLKG